MKIAAGGNARDTRLVFISNERGIHLKVICQFNRPIIPEV
jgi:hypothetical protein